MLQHLPKYKSLDDSVPWQDLRRSHLRGRQTYTTESHWSCPTNSLIWNMVLCSETGTSGTVCRVAWFQEYLDSLSANEIADVIYFTSIKLFKIWQLKRSKVLKSCSHPSKLWTSQVCHQNRHRRSQYTTFIVTFHEKKQVQLKFDSGTIIFNDLEHPTVYMLYQPHPPNS